MLNAVTPIKDSRSGGTLPRSDDTAVVDRFHEEGRAAGHSPLLRLADAAAAVEAGVAYCNQRWTTSSTIWRAWAQMLEATGLSGPSPSSAAPIHYAASWPVRLGWHGDHGARSSARRDHLNWPPAIQIRLRWHRFQRRELQGCASRHHRQGPPRSLASPTRWWPARFTDPAMVARHSRRRLTCHRAQRSVRPPLSSNAS